MPPRDLGEPPEAGLALIPDLLRIDAKLPIIVVLSSNDPELVLRCLRQGASDFLIQPFTSEQVEASAAQDRPAAAQPSEEFRQSLLHHARQGRLRRQHHRQQSGVSDEARRQAHSSGRPGSAGRNPIVSAEDQIQLQLHGRAGARRRTSTPTCGKPWSPAGKAWTCCFRPK